jgi:phosphate transport system permease protein
MKDDIHAPLPPKRQRTEILLTILAGLCTLLALVPLGSVFITVMVRGLPYLTWDALTHLPTPAGIPGGGFSHALQGTCLMVAIALGGSVPLGMLVGIFLAQESGTWAQGMRLGVNVWAGVPSIVIGVFAYGVLVLTRGTFSALAGSFALGLLMLPVIIRTSEAAILAVPQTWQEASFSLGAHRFQTLWRIVLPAAFPGIMTGILLAVARAAGETAPLLFTALYSQYLVQNLNQNTASLAVLIFNYATSYATDLQGKAWAASLVLLLLALGVSILVRGLTRRFG